MVKTGRRMCYSGYGEHRQAFLDRQVKQPDLARLERCLRLFLAGNPEYDPRQAEQTLLCNLPDVPGALVSLFTGWQACRWPESLEPCIDARACK